MTFKTWIKQFKGEDSPLGDLAEDIYRDKSFPYTYKFETMIYHLMNHNACDDCIIISITSKAKSTGLPKNI